MSNIEQLPPSPKVKQAAEWIALGDDRRHDRSGGIVIRQLAAWDEEEDAVVILSTPEVAAKVIAAIKREIGGE